MEIKKNLAKIVRKLCGNFEKVISRWGNVKKTLKILFRKYSKNSVEVFRYIFI